MEKDSFIKVDKSFLNWEWYQDINTKCLFLHCLLKASQSDTSYRGHDIKRGSFLTSIRMLASETGLSVQQTKTALEHLQKSNEITIKPTHKYTIVTLEKYDVFQCSQCYEQHTEQHTNNTQDNTQITRKITNEPTHRATHKYTDKSEDLQRFAKDIYPATNTQSNTQREAQQENNRKTADLKEEKEKCTKEKEEYTQRILLNNTYQSKGGIYNIYNIPPEFESAWGEILTLYPRRRGRESECKEKYFAILEEQKDKETFFEDTKEAIKKYAERYMENNPDDVELRFLKSFSRFFAEDLENEIQDYQRKKLIFRGWMENDKVLKKNELTEVFKSKFDHTGEEIYHEVLREIYRKYPVHSYMPEEYETLYFKLVNEYEDAKGANILYASVEKYLKEHMRKRQYYIPELAYWLKYEAADIMKTITDYRKLIV